MTPRDYFAGLAMQEIMRDENETQPYPSCERLAEIAWDMADAMMAERKKHVVPTEGVVKD